jgi:hypothetical protein
MLMKTKASSLENPNAPIREQGCGICFFVPSAQNLGQAASPWADNGPRGRLRESRGPGDRLVPFPIDILSLVLLIAAGILSRLSLPPQLPRIEQTFLFWAREKPLTRHAPADETAGA